MDHLIERRRDESAQADRIGFFFPRCLQDFGGWHHHAKVDNVVIITLQHDANDVLADIVHVTFHRRHHDPTLWPGALRFLRFHKRHQISDGPFHHARTLHDLRQKHSP